MKEKKPCFGCVWAVFEVTVDDAIAERAGLNLEDFEIRETLFLNTNEAGVETLAASCSESEQLEGSSVSV